MKALTKSILLLTASLALASCGGLNPREQSASSEETTQSSSNSSDSSSAPESTSTVSTEESPISPEGSASESEQSDFESSSEEGPEQESSESEASQESQESSSEEQSSSEASSYEESSESSSEDSSQSSSEETSETSHSSEESSESSEESSESPEETFEPPLGPGEVYLSWDKVTENDLKDGDVIVFGCNENGVVSGGLSFDKSVGYLDVYQASFDGDKAQIDTVFMPIVLKKQLDGSFKFATELGYLGAHSTTKLCFEESAEKSWNISFVNGKASVINADLAYGSLYYNPGAMRFTTYTRKSSSYRDVEIYRATIGTPIYPESISLSGPSSLTLGQSAKLTWEYTPSNANILGVAFESSDEEILCVDEHGEVTAYGLGKATVSIKGYANESDFVALGSIEIEVLPVAVSGITLSDTAKQLSIGQTFTLTPTVLPANATDKSVTWESSSETVATVEEGVVTAWAEGNATITATTVDGSFSATCEITVVAEKLDSWTILMYVCGSNLESEEDYGQISGLATEDLQEILSVQGQPEDVNIIVQTGGAKKWASSLGISNKKLERYSIENGQFKKLQSMNNANMGSQSTLTSFLTWGLENYPASRTGVIFWDHGGAMSGCCQDENYNDMLTPKEVTGALSAAFSANNITSKLEFVGYDCCLMQVADIAEMNSDYFKYMVTSQETELGTGWAYEGWIDDLYRGEETTVVLQAICDSFIASIEDYLDYWEQIDHTEYANDQTLSYIDLSKMAAYKEAVEAYASEKATTIKNNKSDFKKLVKEAKSYADMTLTYSEYYEYVYYYGYNSNYFEKVTIDGQTYYVYRGFYDYGTFDAIDFFNKIATSDKFNSEYVPQVIAAVEEAVCYNCVGDGAGNSNGLTLIANLGGYVKSDYTTSCGSRFTNWVSLFANLF